MKKILLILLITILTTGCTIHNNKGPKVGDFLDYSKYLEIHEYNVDTERSGAPTEQVFKTNKNLKWVVVAKEKEKIWVVADTNTLDTDQIGLGLNHQAGIVNGVNILNELCETLYSTSYGTARSMKVEDLYNLINNEKAKKNHANKNEYTFTNGFFYDGNSFREVTEEDPMPIKSKYYEYSFKKQIALENIVGIEETKDNTESIKQYWLANNGVKVEINKKTSDLNNAQFGMHYMVGNSIKLKELYIADKNEGKTNQTTYLGVRPIVEITNAKYIVKKSNGIRTWSFTK